ncbi:uncharacterized protein PAE49_003815 isoform 2-T2 [Odontesthes bonariensis]|uniref:uncharacterized protein LOC142398333 isoform X2 n=1 Tax=Odontesthes bonariensis TaxID=219752 RepID=UPI003F58CAFC
MDLKDGVVNGAVLIVHQIHEGKHHYDVENVVKYSKGSEKKKFFRGDKLMEINGVDLQDLTPEELAQMLSKGNPMLTVHKAVKKRGEAEQSPAEEDTLQPVSKESTVLSFSWVMMREEESIVGPEGAEEATSDLEEDVCQDKNEENGEGGDLLVIQMMKTSISVVSGRGCDTGSPCQGCHSTGCTLNDVIVVAESSTVTVVPRGSIIFRQEKLSKVLIEHVPSHHYLRGICSQKTPYSSPNPERITIYYYKSNRMDMSFKGMPVVLNLTDSNCFLRCCKEGDKVFLQVETCEKQRLKQISKNDDNTLAYVFYMKADRTKQRRFESALHSGWFICIVNPDLVEMEKLDGGREDPSFLFVIQK